MRTRRHIAWKGLVAAAFFCAFHTAAGTQSVLLAASAAATADEPVVLDRVVGIINGDVLLDSDVQEEMRFAVLQPYGSQAGETSRQRAAERLVNRTLILQQMNDPLQMQKVPQPSDKEVQQRIEELKKQIPACRRYHCETTEGWHQFLAGNGFTERQVETRWRQRIRILQFTEARFRSGIRVPHAEIEAYYEKNLVPQFEKEKVKPPALNTIESRIEEILLQEKVNELLQEWLKSLRDQGSVLILDPSYGESSPGEKDRPGGAE